MGLQPDWLMLWGVKECIQLPDNVVLSILRHLPYSALPRVARSHPCLHCFRERRRVGGLTRVDLDAFSSLRHGTPYNEYRLPFFLTYLSKRLTTPHLTELSLAGTSVLLGTQDLTYIRDHITRLRRLILGDARYRHNPLIAPEAFGVFEMGFKELRSLSLDTCFTLRRYNWVTKLSEHNSVFQFVFSSPRALQSLRALSVRGNDGLFGDFLPLMKQEMESIDLSQCARLREPFLMEFLRRQPKLRTFIFQGQPGMTHSYQAATKEIAAAVLLLPTIQCVDFCHLPGWVSSNTVIVKTSKLREFRINGSLLFTDTDLQRIYSGSRETLEVVGLNRLKELTPSSIGALAKCRTLRELEFADSPKLTDEALVKLGKVSLTHLGIPGTDITDVGLASINAARLKFLDLDACPLVSARGIQYGKS